MTFAVSIVRYAARAVFASTLVAASGSVHAAESPLAATQALGTHGWVMLAAIGLVAVVIAAITVSGPARQRRALMEATTELRDVDDQVELHDVDGTRVEPADTAAAEPPPHSEQRATPEPPAAASVPADIARPYAVAPAHANDDSKVFLALHHVDLSIDVLRRHLEQEQRPMPAVWLMLLDLARTHGREQTFRDLAHEFHRRFNARTPEWEGYPPDRDEPGLEAYPRLVKEITLAWGTHECCRLLDRLLYDTRGGNRTGFTLNAYHDLVALRRAADAVIDTIEQDLAEEAKIRSAFDSVNAELEPPQDDAFADASPLVRELESELDRDLRSEAAPPSALEREHPALARMLAREWGNSALAVRLCEMLARGGDGAHELSKEAADDLETLRMMAERLASVNGIKLPGTDDE